MLSRSPSPSAAPWLDPNQPIQTPWNPTLGTGGRRAMRPKLRAPVRRRVPPPTPQSSQPAAQKKAKISSSGNGTDRDAAAQARSTPDLPNPPSPPRHFISRPGHAPLLVPTWRDAPKAAPRSEHFFIGRTHCPPFVFATSAPLRAPRSNARWARFGEIVEDEYLIEVGAVSVDGAGSTGVVSGAGAEAYATGKSDSRTPGPMHKHSAGKHDRATGYSQEETAAEEIVASRARTNCSRRIRSPVPRASSTAPFATPTFRTSRGWTAAQTRALWKAQLKHGEGKNWTAVIAAVRAAGGAKTQECRHKWARERAKVFAS